MRFYEEEEAGGEAMGVGPASGMGWAPVPATYEGLLRMAQGNAVVVFSVSGCCMCHVVKRLLLGLGVSPKVYEIDQLQRGEAAGLEIQAVLSRLVVGSTTSSASSAEQQTAAVPAVFVGGKLLGGVEKVMACHINGSLIPLLKQAGALWL